MKEEIFRKKSLDKVNSPDRLDQYVKVAHPAIWLVLVAIILLVAGAIVWACTYNVVVKASTSVSVASNAATLKVEDAYFKKVQVGTSFTVNDKEGKVETIDTNNKCFYASFEIADGEYNGYIVIESIHPISYLYK